MGMVVPGQERFGLRIQAKLLHRLSSSSAVGYDIGYRVGGKPTGKRQVDLLIENATSLGAQAAYVLYNPPDDLDLDAFSWPCDRLPASAAFFGVSMLPATVARTLLDKGTLDVAVIAEKSRPWSCLLNCNPFGGCHPWSWPGPPSPWTFWDNEEPIEPNDLAWYAARSFFRMTMRADYDNWTFEQEQALAGQVRQGLSAEPPAYVAALLEGSTQISELPPEIGAVTVVRVPNT